MQTGCSATSGTLELVVEFPLAPAVLAWSLSLPRSPAVLLELSWALVIIFDFGSGGPKPVLSL